MVTISILSIVVAVVFFLVDQLVPAQDPDFLGSQVVDCNREFVSRRTKSGEFGSPNFSQSLHNDVTCKFLFTGEEHERVQIIFKDIQLSNIRESTPTKNTLMNCDDVDSVTVTVFQGAQSQLIGAYCENKRPPMLMSIDHRLEVTFIKRSHSQGRGFQAQYKFVDDFGIKAGEKSEESACKFNFHSEKTPNGTFTSPNFPGLYPRNAECHYLFFGRDNERIYITFPYFDVEGESPRCDEDTLSDFVEFSNFNVQLKDRKMHRLCGTKNANAKNDVNSDGNFFRVTFKSNHIYDATGFEAFYQFRRVDDPYATPKRPSRASHSSAGATNTMATIVSSAVLLNVMATSALKV